MRIADNVVRYASKAPNKLRDKERHSPALTILARVIYIPVASN